MHNAKFDSNDQTTLQGGERKVLIVVAFIHFFFRNLKICLLRKYIIHHIHLILNGLFLPFIFKRLQSQRKRSRWMKIYTYVNSLHYNSHSATVILTVFRLNAACEG